MKINWLIAVGLVVALLAGCGGGSGADKSEAEPVEKVSSGPEDRELWVAMDGWDTAETIGIIMAEHRGYFTKAKLSILTLSPVSPTLSIPDVVNGSDDLGVAHGPQVTIAQEKGVPIVVVGSLVPKATAALIWGKESDIGGIADLKGKTIAIPGLSFQRDYLETILARGGLTFDDVKVKSVGNELVPALVSGKADAIFGGSGNQEGADLESRGIDPVVTPVGSLGIPPYEELVLIARKDRMAEDPKPIRDFVVAVARGTAAAVEDPKAAARVLDESGESNPKTSPRSFQLSVKKTVPLLAEGDSSSP